jgi:hypothetical protein
MRARIGKKLRRARARATASRGEPSLLQNQILVHDDVERGGGLVRAGRIPGAAPMNPLAPAARPATALSAH